MSRFVKMLISALLAFTCSLCGAQQQWRPTHVVVIFDTTRSFWSNLHIAHAITERLLRGLYYALPGHPDDAMTFIVLNATPTIVTELSGLDLRRKAAREFINAFSNPDPRLGTDVVTALELADLAFSRQPQSLKFLFIFSDLIVDPARTPGGLIPFRPLTAFDWSRLNDVSIWVFLCPSEVEMKVKREIPALNRARFFSPPPMTSGIVEKENLQAFTDRIAQKFQAELMQRLKEAPRSDPAGSVNPFKFLGILFGVLAALMVMLIALSRLKGGERR
jgi:hypothetical protein